jgi:glycosyltransferase involved in cell wall biosynthesis
MSTTGNLTIVQYAGDFREAAARLSGGGDENYRAQRLTVNYVEDIAKRFDRVTTITWMTDEKYDEILPSGVRAIGAGGGAISFSKLIGLIESTQPDLLILRSPFRQLLQWSSRNKIRTMALLADSFVPRTLKQRLSFYNLKKHLNRSNIEVVANHGLKAASSLQSIGVDARKILAWDYPAFDSPHNQKPKSSPSANHQICYVGNLSPGKGVFDLVDAVYFLVEKGHFMNVDIIGSGETEALEKYVNISGVADYFNFFGPIPNNQIIPRMRQSDIVVVPSRHSYGEGMPLTIYEALCSRTPLVVSDHPMFVGNVRHEESALIFKAEDSRDMAKQIIRLLKDRELYARLSEQSTTAWDRLQIPVKWGDLIDCWISGPASTASLLDKYSFAALDQSHT